MAEFLIRVHGTTATDPLLRFRVGDVIAFHDNGHDWSPRELTRPHWRIIQVNGLSAAQIDGYLSRALSADPNIRARGRRGQYLDINDASITGALRTYLDDDTRAAPMYSMTKQQAIALTKAHPIENQP